MNTMTSTLTQVYSQTANDENIPNSFEGGPLKVLESYFWNPESEVEGVWQPAGETITNVNHTEGPVEIKG